MRRQIRLAAAALAITVLLADAGVAAEAQLSLPTPEGYCAFSRDIEADRQFLKAMKTLNQGRNEVLTLFAKCPELDRYRAAGSEIAHHGGYLAPQSAARQRITMPRREFVEQVAQATRKIDMSAVEQEVRQRMTWTDSTARLNNLSRVGVIHADDDAVYLGIVQSVTSDQGRMFNVATVTGLTLVRGRVISVNLSAPYENQGSIDRLLAAQQDNVRRLLSRNPDGAG